jgi:O-antigen chain-terminating methyltransferase
MSQYFYRAFEDKHRGSRDLVESRLRIYLPFITPLTTTYTNCRALDLGCGRGEWLDLLHDQGISAHGVDLDDGMLEACRERGLSVERAEAVAHIKSLPDESQVLVSGFHLVEHLPFSDVQMLVQEALRVLKPAGLLILETPNTENIEVGATSFYLDPTHVRPVPSELLLFLCEYHGYYRSKILRLQEPLNDASSQSPSLLSVLRGVSPDYSVVAQKDAPWETLARFDGVFSSQHGLTLETVTTNYDLQMEMRTRDLASQLVTLRDDVATIQIRLDRVQYIIHKITAPARYARTVVRVLQGLPHRLSAIATATIGPRPAPQTLVPQPSPPQGTPRKRFGRLLMALKHAVDRHPWAERLIGGVLSKFPNLRARLRNVGHSANSMQAGATRASACMKSREDAPDLSPRARRIYSYLRAATTSKK